jgi:hypothetical protein
VLAGQIRRTNRTEVYQFVQSYVAIISSLETGFIEIMTEEPGELF